MEIKTPGRICLFGEHQDYLGLPVIAMAVSLYSKIKGSRNQEAGNSIVIHKPDLKESESFPLSDLSYLKPRDYFKSGLKVCINEGLSFSTGFECEISSQIPIQAGCSSSSSIMVGWIHFLSQIADNPINWTSDKIAELAYRAEVLEFDEPGGMMDQYSTASGDLIYLESQPEITITTLKTMPGAFVLGDSRVKKDTHENLRRCKTSRIEIVQRMKDVNPEFSLQTIQYMEINDYRKYLNSIEMELLLGTVRNRDILIDALGEFKSSNLDFEGIGELLTEEHSILRDILHVSTPKIDHLLDIARDTGAVGGKINGSGGGGCMFVYAPDNPEVVAAAIENAGGKAYIVHTSEGTKVST